MSISLDTALFLREQRVTNPLTLSERGVLFTLFFRVGSNPFTWISQESLATELDVSTRQVKRQMQSLVKKGFVEILADSKDKRKNLYRPAEFLINYHQNPDRKNTKKVIHNPTDEQENKGHICHLKSTDRGHICHLNRGHICHLISDEEISTDTVVDAKNEGGKIPKDTIESNIYIKQKNKGDNLIQDLPDFIDKSLYKDFMEHRKSLKRPVTETIHKRIVQKLIKFKNEGQPINEILNNSIVNGWQGIFPINQRSLKNGNETSKADRRAACTRDTIEKYKEAIRRETGEDISEVDVYDLLAI